jgi:hypothetical protein
MKYKKPLIYIVDSAPNSSKKICNADAFSCYIPKDYRDIKLEKCKLVKFDLKNYPK